VQGLSENFASKTWSKAKLEMQDNGT